MKLAGQKNHLGGQILYRSPDPGKNLRFFIIEGTFYTDRNEAVTEIHHLLDLGAYSLRPHGTALWELNKESNKLVRLLDLPGCGDTARV